MSKTINCDRCTACADAGVSTADAIVYPRGWSILVLTVSKIETVEVDLCEDCTAVVKSIATGEKVANES